ncbi:MAG TPA: maleylpyruvate isomerase family mycothiol-dependent enzyme [Acidimicrobiales bacterium]
MLDHLAHIRRESERFIQVLAASDPAAEVPTCPGWSASDLLWHLAEVHLFWAAVVGDRLQDPDEAEARKPSRPTDHPALVALMREASAALVESLATTPVDTPVWTWWDDDQTAGFVLRWQAHEALMHRLDAELTADAVSPIDPALAADGVDVVLRFSYAWIPDWAPFAPSGVVGRVETTDTDDSWLVELGRFTGTSPNTGKHWDQPVLRVVDRGRPTFTARGPSADLDRWLWSRGIAVPDVEGDRAGFDELAAIVATGVQ